MTIPPTDPAEAKLMALLEPVFSNTYWVENALGVLEGIAKHATELNDGYGHFFGLIHQFSLDSVVLGICKLFDRTKSYPISTVPALVSYLKDNLTQTYIGRLVDANSLTDLGLSDVDANRIITEFRINNNFPTTKNELTSLLKSKMPTCARSPALKQIFLYRNKVAAHQEALTDAVKHQLKDLPSIDEMEKLNKWAIDFCLLMRSIMTNGTYLRHGVSARIAALNVVAKVLGKNFGPSDRQERKAFYSRL
jgi:hypothetical protein